MSELQSIEDATGTSQLSSEEPELTVHSTTGYDDVEQVCYGGEQVYY